MTGKEMANLLIDACQDAGLTEYQTNQVCLAFSIRWGTQLGEQLDLAMYEEELAMPPEPGLPEPE